MRISRCPADIAVVRIDLERGETSTQSRFTVFFSLANPALCPAIIESVGESEIQFLFKRGKRYRRGDEVVRQREILGLRQSDRTRDIQFLLGAIVLCSDEPLLLNLQLDLRANDIDCRNQAARLQVHRSVILSLRRHQLSARSVLAARARNSL